MFNALEMSYVLAILLAPTAILYGPRRSSALKVPCPDADMLSLVFGNDMFPNTPRCALF